MKIGDIVQLMNGEILTVKYVFRSARGMMFHGITPSGVIYRNVCEDELKPTINKKELSHENNHNKKKSYRK